VKIDPESDIRNFSKEEIADVSVYLDASVPHTLVNDLFVLSESLHEKAMIFVSIFRVLLTASNYVGNESTRKKLKEMLSK